uniref:Uncharacterized protein n=1 Tax=Romanomermis culicivorax TaxID=13658 RepID=A0A915KBR3_ROMCU
MLTYGPNQVERKNCSKTHKNKFDLHKYGAFVVTPSDEILIVTVGVFFAKLAGALPFALAVMGMAEKKLPLKWCLMGGLKGACIFTGAED